MYLFVQYYVCSWPMLIHTHTHTHIHIHTHTHTHTLPLMHTHVNLCIQKVRWMRVLLLFTGQLCFPRGTVCPYATSKSNQCGSHPCDKKNTPHSLQNHVVCVRFLCCERVQCLLFLSSSDGSLSTFSGKCCRGRGRMTSPPGPAQRCAVYSPIRSLASCSRNFLMVLKVGE